MGQSDATRAIAVLSAICDRIEQEQSYLCELDAALGDGDHGISMAKSFHAVRLKLAGLETGDLGAILNAVGMTLISEVGGAMGPLFGTAFLRAGNTHARLCVEAAGLFADGGATAAQRRAALERLGTFRKSVEGQCIANYQPLCQEEQRSWGGSEGFLSKE